MKITDVTLETRPLFLPPLWDGPYLTHASPKTPCSSPPARVLKIHGTITYFT
jgi:hypothetical protein